MSTPIIIEVWNALATRAAADYSSGYSGLDMTDQIFKGRFVEAPMIPSVYVGYISQTQQNGTTLTRYYVNDDVSNVLFHQWFKQL